MVLDLFRVRPGGDLILRRFLRWYLASELTDQYLLGWGHGVEQERFEPETTRHHDTGELEYWCQGD